MDGGVRGGADAAALRDKPHSGTQRGGKGAGGARSVVDEGIDDGGDAAYAVRKLEGIKRRRELKDRHSRRRHLDVFERGLTYEVRQELRRRKGRSSGASHRVGPACEAAAARLPHSAPSAFARKAVVAEVVAVPSEAPARGGAGGGDTAADPAATGAAERPSPSGGERRWKDRGTGRGRRAKRQGPRRRTRNNSFPRRKPRPRGTHRNGGKVYSCKICARYLAKQTHERISTKRDMVDAARLYKTLAHDSARNGSAMRATAVAALLA